VRTADKKDHLDCTADELPSYLPVENKENYGVINAANLKLAHAMLDSGRTIATTVLEGF
jgi:hypothetical protein